MTLRMHDGRNITYNVADIDSIVFDDEQEPIFVTTETGLSSEVFSSRVEIPRLTGDDVLIVHQATDMEGNPVNYSAAYRPEKYHPRWVAYRFDSELSAQNVSRKSSGERPQYPTDPLYSEQPYDDASFQGYDHGHLCASADRTCSRLCNDQTFYMTNMSPMKARFNRYYWTYYESHIQSLARTEGFADTLYVVKGGTLDDFPCDTIKVAGRDMPVPGYYFIALLKVKDGRYSSIGFWMEHKEYESVTDKTEEIFAHAVTIDQLEILTDIDFFHNLPDAVETNAEMTFSREEWE